MNRKTAATAYPPMRRLKFFVSLTFFTIYLVIQCVLCLRSIASETRLEYGFGMYTAKPYPPYRVVRLDGTSEAFEMERDLANLRLEFRSLDTDMVLSYPTASKPQWSPQLVCRAHRPDAAAIEWMEEGEPRSLACRD